MKQRLPRICAYVASIGLILVLLVTSIDVNCFNKGFFESEYTTMETAKSLHMSNEDLMKATNALLDYLQDDRDNIDVDIEVYEMERKAFNERETLHMIDVKNLYQFALSLRFWSGVLLVVSIVTLIYMKRKEIVHELSVAYAKTALCFLCFVAMLGIWAQVDFTSLWESFHRLFFDNDLWLLNPRTDLMINMFPEAFFFHMVLRIAGMFLIVFLGLWMGSLLYLKKEYHISFRKKGGNKDDNVIDFSEQ